MQRAKYQVSHGQEHTIPSIVCCYKVNDAFVLTPELRTFTTRAEVGVVNFRVGYATVVLHTKSCYL
ncbi:hypothetical protein PISMIDRAFT_382117 [Pisolithus microcarpus 441]|uniref:Uncharacterized protein n=1 Tax=Pisolithus microcarpus 441 TaxID=765257 RepID=A0A0C9YY64_9AGAM|nr:hypothetical protein PISMIDRAFT_382117 [Pisolithus microcarpus 441]